MRAKHSYLLIFILLSSIVQAQKVDLDRYNFTTSYIQLPTEPLEPDHKTYDIKFDAAPSVRYSFTDDALRGLLNIDGLKKVSPKGHISINLLLDDLIIENNQIKERVEIKKDKDGKETGRKYYYSMEVIYSFAARASLYDYKGNVIMQSYPLAERQTKLVFNTPETSNSTDASNYFNKNQFSIRDQLTRQAVQNNIDKLNVTLSAKYGYVNRQQNDILWILDSKKHPEYNAHKSAWETFKYATNTIRTYELRQEQKDKLLELVNYFNSLKTKYVSSEKSDKKIRYASFYNNAKIYLILDNPEAAIKEAEGLIANGYDEGDGRRLKQEAENMITLFQRNNITTRHFKIDVTTYHPPTL